MLHYVGIDIAKLNHFAAILSSDGEVLVEPFQFTNDNDGFCKLVSTLDSFEKDSLIIGLESTAHYGNNLVEFLVSKHYNICVITTPSRHPQCERTTSAKPRRIRLTQL